jgi:hypothetical protein
MLNGFGLISEYFFGYNATGHVSCSDLQSQSEYRTTQGGNP